MCKNEVIDRYMHCIMQNLKKNAQVCLYSIADLNIGHDHKGLAFNNESGLKHVIKLPWLKYFHDKE